MEQARLNADHYSWDRITDFEDLEQTRMAAMELFLTDYEKGKQQGRYQFHELPNRIPFADKAFDLGLCSHFLLLYPTLGWQFHIAAIEEMMRVCKEVRISPAVDHDGIRPPFFDKLMEFLQQRYKVEEITTSYAFLKNENQYIRIAEIIV